ncbi:MAG: hypothetical protein E6Q97_29915 [Desulfurellales bacterium]|nr:MAG: hypothetical protein E6Q97_29915 [Desulfurellales bacterium]
MTITRVVDGNTSAATNLNQLIDLMEGAESIDFLLMSLTATDFKVRLADAGGTRKFIIQDSAGSTVAYVDSDGNASFTSIALTSLVIPAAASPAQTADASVVWDSDGDFLTIGDGTSRKAFYPDTAGSDIASASTLNITDSRHRVTGTTGITAISNKPAGYVVVLTFASTPTLTHSSSLRLAGGANYTVTAEETMAFVSDGTNWREVGRKGSSKASGISTSVTLSTTSTSYSDAGSVTITPQSGSVLVLATYALRPIWDDSTDRGTVMALRVDSAAEVAAVDYNYHNVKQWTDGTSVAASNGQLGFTMYLFTGLSAASHTFALRGKAGSGTTENAGVISGTIVAVEV